MARLGGDRDDLLKMLCFVTALYGKERLEIKTEDLEATWARLGLTITSTTSGDSTHLYLYARQPTYIDPSTQTPSSGPEGAASGSGGPEDGGSGVGDDGGSSWN